MPQRGLYALTREFGSAVQERCVDLVQHGHRVARPLSYPSCCHLAYEPGGHRGVAQIVWPGG